MLASAGLPHPRTVRLTRASDASTFRFPVVVKPRFGSWGRDVEMCPDKAALDRYLRASFAKPWGRAGAVLQELVEPTGRDLRIVVSGQRVVGAASRRARMGEWRTNVALGAAIEPAVADEAACELAVAATRILGLDLVGVDLLLGADGYVVVELNGAVEFRSLYSQTTDVFAAALAELARPPRLVVSDRYDEVVNDLSRDVVLRPDQGVRIAREWPRSAPLPMSS